MFWLYFSFVYLLDVIGLYFAKQYSLTNGLWDMAFSALSFAGVGVFFSLALTQKGTLALANVLWAGLATVLITALGYFYFQENISLIQFFGIGVVLAGIVLIHIE